MAQLRQDYEKFQDLDAEVLAVAPDTMGNARSYFSRNELPFPGLVDNEHEVFDRYDVQSKLISLGQRPGLFIIDKEGVVRLAYVGAQQWEIPANEDVLLELSELEERSAA